MDLQNNSLLEKYWKGETSIEEERILKRSESSSNEPISHFLKAIKERQETAPSFEFEHPRKRVRMWWYTIAASLVVGLMLTIGISNLKSPQAQYNINDPDQAYLVTMQALAMVSSGLNEGGKIASQEFQTLSTPVDIIGKTTKTNY